MVLRSAIEAIVFFAFYAKVFSIVLLPFVNDESVIAIRGRAPLDIHLAIKGLLKRILVELIDLICAHALLHVAFTNLFSALIVGADQWAFGLVNVRLQKVVKAFLVKHVSTTSQRYNFRPFI